MKRTISLVAGVFFLVTAGCYGGGTTVSGDGGASSTGAPGAPGAAHDVRINGAVPDASELGRLEAKYGTKVSPGAYWYDRRSGLGGTLGGAAAVYAPGFDFGVVPRDASHGTTGLLFNGRELPLVEARFVASLYDLAPGDIPKYAGEYVLDPNGDLTRSSDGQYLGNLVELARQKGLLSGGGGSGGGDNFWSTSSGAAGNSSGGCSYIALPGGDSVTSGCG